MKLIALILGLVIERAATHLLHLRELRWFDAYFDYGAAQIRKLPDGLAVVGTLAVLLLPVLPVGLVSIAFRDVLWDLPYLVFAVIVLLFSLGPKDLGEEVEEFCGATKTGNADGARRVAKVLLETDVEAETEPRAIGEAIFIQANNRIFGVVFWFVVLGPLGAWLFRVSDLFRRRTAFEGGRGAGVNNHIELIHGLLSYIPARLAALGYAVGGSFDDAVDAWREYLPAEDERFSRTTDRIAATVGCGAMAVGGTPPADNHAAASNAMRLVTRALFAWITVLALMTLFGWAI
jgi:AmpE protein